MQRFMLDLRTAYNIGLYRNNTVYNIACIIIKRFLDLTLILVGYLMVGLRDF